MKNEAGKRIADTPTFLPLKISFSPYFLEAEVKLAGRDSGNVLDVWFKFNPINGKPEQALISADL